MESNKIVFDYIKKHDWSKLKKIISSTPNIDVNIRDENNNYLISYSILYNNIEITALLLEKNSQIDFIDNDYKTILYIPIKYNYYDVVKLLLEYNVKNIGEPIISIKDGSGLIPLHYAINFNNTQMIQLLLKFGSNVNDKNNQGFNSLHQAIFIRSYPLIKIILEYDIDINARTYNGETALHMAINFELDDIIQLLLDKDIDVNILDYDHEYSSLHYAINLNNKFAIKLLINHNVNINSQDVLGNTPLHYGIIENNYDCIAIILTNSIMQFNYDITNIDGNTLLHLVFEYYDRNIDDENLIKYLDLLIINTNINIQNKNGISCLHYLYKYDLWKKYKSALIKKKSNIFVKDKNNVRPIDYIKKIDVDELINLLSDSYLYLLKIRSNTNWIHDWENICKKENFDKKETDILNSYVETKKSDSQCIDIIKNKITNLIKESKIKSIDCTDIVYPVKQNKTCIKIDEGKNMNVCTFTGNILDILAGLLFLLKKHKDACSIIVNNQILNKKLCLYYKRNGIPTNVECEIINFELMWAYDKLYIIDNFGDKFKQCIGVKNKRFIIIPLGLILKDSGHANYLIYDDIKKEVERFEPHGAGHPIGMNYHPELLDNVLEKTFFEINSEIKYIRPQDFLPKIGLQILDITEEKTKRIGDPGGFCALWSMWYVDMRIQHHSVDRKKLVKKMITQIKANNISFKNLIRNYSNEILKLRDQLLKNSNLNINDWINRNYTDANLKLLAENIFKLYAQTLK